MICGFIFAMSNSTRIILANILAPLVGLLSWLPTWYFIGATCEAGPSCLGWTPLTFVLLLLYLGFLVFFLIGAKPRASNLFEMGSFNYFAFSKRANSVAIILSLSLLGLAISSKIPNNAMDQLMAISSVLLPLISVVSVNYSWYFIVGKYNNNLKSTSLPIGDFGLKD